MRTILFSIITVLSLISLNSFAGGSGGGGVLMNAMRAQNREIIYNMGQKDGTVKFAYGQLVDKQWQVQKLEMAVSDLEGDTSVIKALQDSKSLNSWAEIK